MNKIKNDEWMPDAGPGRRVNSCANPQKKNTQSQRLEIVVVLTICIKTIIEFIT